MENRIEIRTDLALEEKERAIPKKGLKDGILAKVIAEEKEVLVTMVEIVNEIGSEIMKKPMGVYYTIEAQRLGVNDMEYQRKLSQVVAKYLTMIIQKELVNVKDIKVLIIGLGNRQVTPDAIGPKVIEYISVNERVMAVAPGVLAQTGIETARIVKGIVEEIEPDILIAVDALAARSVKRLNTTIQISNVGIYPGQGVGNHRMGITKANIGCPVIAIGVPTVVDAPTIISDVFDNVLKSLDVKSYLLELPEKQKYEIIKEAMPEEVASMFVTPKDIDEAANIIGYTISEAINITFE